MGEPLRGICRTEFLKLLMVLREDVAAAPHSVQIAITGKLLQDEFVDAVSQSDEKQAVAQVKNIAERLLFPISKGTDETGKLKPAVVKVCDVHRASFGPILDDVMKIAGSCDSIEELDLFGDEQGLSAETTRQQKKNDELQEKIQAVRVESGRVERRHRHR